LDLGYGKLDAGAVEALLTAPWVAGLTHLELSNNSIGVEGASALARAPQLENLVSLDVTRNDLSEEAGNLLDDRFGERVQVKASWERYRGRGEDPGWAGASPLLVSADNLTGSCLTAVARPSPAR